MFRKMILPVVLVVALLFGCAFSFPAPASGVSGYDIVAFARQYIGYPYVYNTHGPDSFDCSGFAHFVYAHFGIETPYSSSAYWNDPSAYGVVIAYGSAENAQPGDLISWYGHVAIYTENGYCIEALNSRSGVVERFRVSEHPSGSNFRLIRITGVENILPPDASGVTQPGTVVLETLPEEGITEGRIDEDDELQSARPVGDVNGDGKVTSKDARVVLRAVSRLLQLTGEDVSAADADKDGKLRSRDARLILRVAARLEKL